jgi:ATP-dependent Clp protease ATP-binding subunit ClpC
MMKDAVMKEVKEVFRPEFINRLDELIVFHSLSEDNIRDIAGLMLRQVAGLLRERNVTLSWDEEVVRYLARTGYDPKFGARPLRRLIQRTVEDTLSEELLQGRISLGQAVKLTVRDGQIVLDCAPQEAEQKETEQKDPTPAGEEPAGETTTTEEE